MPEATVMLALPEAKLAVGVKVAVRVRPLPLIAPSVPPVTTTSPAVPFHVKVPPGSSLKVKVMVAVSPALSVALLLVIVSVGAVVSTMTVSTPLVPALFARSMWFKVKMRSPCVASLVVWNMSPCSIFCTSEALNAPPPFLLRVSILLVL